MDIDQLEELAARAADLIPEAPVSGDALSWLSWRNLVWDVALQLSAVAGTELAGAHYPACDDLEAARVSPAALLGLAARFQSEAGIHAINPSH